MAEAKQRSLANSSSDRQVTVLLLPMLFWLLLLLGCIATPHYTCIIQMPYEV